MNDVVSPAALSGASTQWPRTADEMLRTGLLNQWYLVCRSSQVTDKPIRITRTGAKASAGVIAVDGFRWAADVVFLLGAALTILLGIESNPRDRIVAPESHVLVLFATSGMMIMAAARDLMIVFLGVEMMSIAVYVLAGLNRGSVRSAEGALKYFLLGAFSTGFLLYGIALVYGATGSTDIIVIGQRIVQYSLTGHSMLLIGVGLLLVGFAFKVAAVPFHMWTPDAYEGAPSVVTAFMSTGVKAAAVAAFVRVFLKGLDPMIADWAPVLWWIAAATMIIGTVVGVRLFRSDSNEFLGRVTKRLQPLYDGSRSRWYFDDLNDLVFVRFGRKFANALWWFDRRVVDGTVNGVATLASSGGRGLRQIQTGRVQNYALGIAFGLVAIAAASGRLFAMPVRPSMALPMKSLLPTNVAVM